MGREAQSFDLGECVAGVQFRGKPFQVARAEHEHGNCKDSGHHANLTHQPCIVFSVILNDLGFVIEELLPALSTLTLPLYLRAKPMKVV